MEKETAVFSCEVSNTNEPVKWLRQGFELSPSDKRFEVISDGVNMKLIIKDARLDDHGEYTCVIGDKQTSAILFVEGKRPLPVNAQKVKKVKRERTDKVGCRVGLHATKKLPICLVV